MGIRVHGVQLTHHTKANMIEALQLAFEKDAIKIINDPVLVAELQAFEATKLPTSGLIRYAAPAGQHDDCVMALALAYLAALADKSQGRQYEFRVA